jgi:hypothetical protein
MKIYHGTTEAVARAAVTEGLKPRGESGVKTNWENCPSRSDLVYLTTAYAGYFGISASEPGDPIGIIEVDLELLDQSLLLPDEDFIEQGSRGDSQWDNKWIQSALVGLDMTERTAFFRDNLELFSSLWTDSLAHLGNCAYKGSIPREAISRICIFDPKENPTIHHLALDPTISLLNYQFCGNKYRSLCRWLIGDPVAAGDLMLMPQIDYRMAESDPEGLANQIRDQMADLQVDLDQGAGRDLIY